MNFSFWLKTDVRIGPGSAASVLDYIEKRAVEKVAVIVDSGLHGNTHLQQLVDGLRSSAKHVQVVENDAYEPTYGYLEEFKKTFDSGLDLIVGIGGGSTLDLTKAVSVLLTNPGPAISYRGFDKIKNPGVPVIAVPTTAGTGSEVTPNAVFTDADEQRKLGINTTLYVPVMAVLDPFLTVSCPRVVTVSSGIDALVHAVETYVSKGATPVSRVLSKEAFRLVMTNLPAVVDRADDLDARSAMQVAALYGGIALINSGGGITGALSYPLGVRFKVPHGLAGGIFLATASRHNVALGAHQYGDLYDMLEGAPALSDAQERSEAVCAALDNLADRLELPRSLKVFGVDESDLDRLAEETFLLTGSVQQNPVELSKEDVLKIIETIA